MCLMARHSLALIICSALLASSPAFAQDQPPATGERASAPRARTTGTASRSNAPELLTAKERLSEKWTDEQRVDNCKVPIDKRGPKPRPDTCPNVPAE
jgi:hypothetical protein